MQLEYIAIIVNYIHFSGLLDYVYFATKQPLKPTSIHVQQMRYFLKPLLLDFLIGPMIQKTDGNLTAN